MLKKYSTLILTAIFLIVAFIGYETSQPHPTRAPAATEQTPKKQGPAKDSLVGPKLSWLKKSFGGSQKGSH